MGKLLRQFGRFSVIGVSAFIIDYGLLVVLTEVFDVNYLLSATVSFCVSVTYNYFGSTRFVFKHREGMKRSHEAAVFVALASVGLVINDGLMFLGTELLGVTYLVTKLAATAVVTVWNFITRKLFLESHV